MTTFQEFWDTYVRTDPRAPSRAYKESRGWRPRKSYTPDQIAQMTANQQAKRNRTLRLLETFKEPLPLYRLSKKQYIRKRGNKKKGFKKGDLYRRSIPWYPFKLGTLLAGTGKYKSYKPNKTDWQIGDSGRPFKTYTTEGGHILKKIIRTPGGQPFRLLKGYPGNMTRDTWRALRTDPSGIPALLQAGEIKRARMREGLMSYRQARKASGIRGKGARALWGAKWNEIKKARKNNAAPAVVIAPQEEVSSYSEPFVKALLDLPEIKPLVIQEEVAPIPVETVVQGTKRLRPEGLVVLPGDRYGGRASRRRSMSFSKKT